MVDMLYFRNNGTTTVRFLDRGAARRGASGVHKKTKTKHRRFHTNKDCRERERRSRDVTTEGRSTRCITATARRVRPDHRGGGATGRTLLGGALNGLVKVVLLLIVSRGRVLANVGCCGQEQQAKGDRGRLRGPRSF